jgi:hypothetical protein
MYLSARTLTSIGILLLPVSLGTMVGKHDDSCFGAQYAMDPNNWIAACSNDGVSQFTVTCKPVLYTESVSGSNVKTESYRQCSMP